MHRAHAKHSAHFLAKSTLALALAFALVAIAVRPAYATFHLVNITKVMVGFNGNTNIQAVELKMVLGGQNLVSGVELSSYDGAGNKVGTLGTFAANLPNSLSGDNILCATALFRDTFGITPDLLIAPGLLVTSGQVLFEKPSPLCTVNSVAYGDVPTPLPSSGPSSAAPLPAQGAAVLVRTVDDATAPSCPLSENSGARMVLRTGSPTNPIVFRNNARTTVNVFSTVTGTNGAPPVLPALRAAPNPFRETTVIEAPEWRPLSIYDIQGRLVRVLTCAPGEACPTVAGPFRGQWDGTDSQGRVMPSGIYLLRYTGAYGLVVKRIALTR
jgi:hypothetical protein